MNPNPNREKYNQSDCLAMGKCDLCSTLYVKMSATILGVEAQINFNGRQDLKSLQSWSSESRDVSGNSISARERETEPKSWGCGTEVTFGCEHGKYSPEASSNFLPLALGIIVH